MNINLELSFQELASDFFGYKRQIRALHHNNSNVIAICCGLVMWYAQYNVSGIKSQVHIQEKKP